MTLGNSDTVIIVKRSWKRLVITIEIQSLIDGYNGNV